MPELEGLNLEPDHRRTSCYLFHHCAHCRFVASFFNFFASFFSFGDLRATFFSVFFASWALLIMYSVVDLKLLPGFDPRLAVSLC